MSNINPIKFMYNDKEYTLEFTRESIRQLERSGFNIAEVETKPMLTIPKLFAGAFLAHHRFIKQETVDEIFETMTNKGALLERLIALYQLPFEYLVSDGKDEKNAIKWE